MKTRNSKSLLLLTPLLLTGCSHDYAPAADATGEQIFQEACRECHQPDAEGIIYSLKPENANQNYIANKVKNGSFMMPSFPELKADDIKKLSDYVLAHSRKK